MTRDIIKVLALLPLFTTSGGWAASAEGLTYGDKPTFQSDGNFSYSLSPDKQAVTLTFPDFSAEAGPSADGGKIAKAIGKLKRAATGNPPITSRAFSIVIPVKAGTPFKTSFHVQGYAFTNGGGRATLLFGVNGQNTVASFAPNTDSDSFPQFDYATESTSEIRLTVFLQAERDGQFQDAAAHINIIAIDIGLDQAQSSAAAAKAKKK
jgi:hypothetical protein